MGEPTSVQLLPSRITLTHLAPDDDPVKQHAAVELVVRATNLRSAIFWSAYSLDRTLSVILGRPLTLRDEAIDVPFPGELESDEIEHDAVNGEGREHLVRVGDEEPAAKRVRVDPAAQSTTSQPTPILHTPALYSFRFDRITAEIKLMIYRVAQSPSRFPWPTNLREWQKRVHETCNNLLSRAGKDLKGRGTRRPDRIMRALDLKYHQCLMLLYRPSPAFPQPSLEALKACYDSSVATIRIYSEMTRFAHLNDSWLTAHSVFVSGITMLYCLWTSPWIWQQTSLKTFSELTESSIKVLQKLGATWSVAESARVKYERLVQLTTASWGQGRTDALGMPVAQNGGQATVEYDVHDNNSNNNNNGSGPTDDGTFFADNLPNNLWGGPENMGPLQAPSMFLDEIGDMSGWFDLDWLGDLSNSSYAYPDDAAYGACR